MVITYHGIGMVRIQQGDTVICFNPIGKDASQKPARFGADLVLVSRNHPNWNGVDQMEYGSKKPVVLDGPGEYETMDMFIRGIGVFQDHDEEKVVNTIYTLYLEGVTICHLGAPLSTKLPDEILEEIGEIDILLLPIGAKTEHTLSSNDAHALATRLESKIVIPLWVGTHGEDETALNNFIKAFGGKKPDMLDKLTLKKKDIESKEGELVVLGVGNS